MSYIAGQLVRYIHGKSGADVLKHADGTTTTRSILFNV